MERDSIFDYDRSKKTTGVIKKLMPCLKGYGRYTVFSIFTIIIEAVFEMLIPLIMKVLIDTGIEEAKAGNYAPVFKYGGIMIALALLSLFFGAISARLAAISSTGFVTGLRSKVFNKIQSFSFSNMDKFSTASLITRLTNDASMIQNAFHISIRIGIRAPVLLIVATILTITINAKLSLIFAFALPVLGVTFALLASIAFPRLKKMLEEYDSMNAGVQENLIGIRVIKAFVSQKREKESFNKKSDRVKDAGIAAESLLILMQPISMLVIYAVMLAVGYFGGTMIMNGAMSAGDFTSFLSYIAQILMSVIMISLTFMQLVLSRASMARVIEVIDEEPYITDDNNDPDLTVKDGSIEFNNVSFAYGEGLNVLCDINLRIEPGETVGIIGGTGSAKTTLVQLIPRLYDVKSGSVKVGGVDVRDYKLKNLRDAVSMVLQKNVLFSGTIEENLRWGKHDATMNEIIEAAKIAQAHDFIMSFPNGYQTDLGQGGVNVSGGQKQRLTIARALLKSPKVLILDDSTSAVDTNTDANIRKALKEKTKDLTTIIIAQRVNSIMEADKIVVLNEGRIADIGKHDELLRRCEIYREVYSSQTREVG
ncbi:MAG TPA: ABC transporter ATP-binding protein [Clostridiales bacterium]|jgi:ATP-binding cassette subfamily B multidrug efflux pump|nr:ABC transporter ATP-binding protein [Clostridiales bacterium]